MSTAHPATPAARLAAITASIAHAAELAGRKPESVTLIAVSKTKSAEEITPLLDAGMTKDDVRRASRRWGLPTWDKPAAACLSSRVAYGVEVTPHRLARVERAEAAARAALADEGLESRDLRVRDLGERASIEVDRDLVGGPLAEGAPGADAVVAAVVAVGTALVHGQVRDVGPIERVTLCSGSYADFRQVFTREAPAGVFERCVTVEGRSRIDDRATLVNQLTFAKGVGLVRVEVMIEQEGRKVPQSSLALKQYALGGRARRNEEQ